MAGRFIAFDGVDGAGKSTQIDLFCSHLDQLGEPYVRCRDPGATALGEKLRGILLHRHDTKVGIRAEMLIYMAARAQLVEQIIQPALKAGKTVVSDRFLLSNVAYQGYAGGLPVDDVWSVGGIATDGVAPDLTIFFDLPLETARQRREGAADRIEARSEAFFEQVRQGFLTEAKRTPDEIAIVDASGTVEEVRQLVLSRFQAFLDSQVAS